MKRNGGEIITEGAREEPCKEGGLGDGSGDGAINGVQDNSTDGTLTVALDKASDCRWGNEDEDLVNKCSVSHVWFFIM